jgi:hypothetical protein
LVFLLGACIHHLFLSSRVSVVCAHFDTGLLQLFSFLLLLEQDNLDALSGDSVANAFEGEFGGRPEGALEVVEDGSSIAVFFSDTLSDHFSEYFLGEELVL